jgi:hypothetical protein
VTITDLMGHANIRCRIPAFMHRLAVTPEFHRLHHAADPRLGNSNYGVEFPCWDMAFGRADNILDAPCDDSAMRPTLAQTQVQAAHIKDVPKTLRFDSANFPDMVGKTEGMALLGDGSLVLINDDDFGITGGRTQIVVLRGSGIAQR